MKNSVSLVTEAYNLAEGQSEAAFLRAVEAITKMAEHTKSVEILVMDPSEKNIAIEYRYAEGKEDRLPALVGELLALMVDVIVVQGGNATLAAKNATSTIPIVMPATSDPLGAGS